MAFSGVVLSFFPESVSESLRFFFLAGSVLLENRIPRCRWGIWICFFVMTLYMLWFEIKCIKTYLIELNMASMNPELSETLCGDLGVFGLLSSDCRFLFSGMLSEGRLLLLLLSLSLFNVLE